MDSEPVNGTAIEKTMPKTRRDLERTLRAFAHDLSTFSVSLRMRDGFVREFGAVHPLLVELGEPEYAGRVRAQFEQLQDEYRRIGEPTSIDAPGASAYFDKATAFADSILDHVLKTYPRREGRRRHDPYYLLNG